MLLITRDATGDGPPPTTNNSRVPTAPPLLYGMVGLSIFVSVASMFFNTAQLTSIVPGMGVQGSEEYLLAFVPPSSWSAFIASSSSSSDGVDDDNNNINNITNVTKTTTIASSSSSGNKTLHILYIVTSSSRTYRKNKSPRDRWNDMVQPILLMNIESLLLAKDHDADVAVDAKTTSLAHVSIHVDLYLILSYDLVSDERATLRQLLPKSVGIQVWSDATPLGYRCKQWGVKNGGSVSELTTLGNQCAPGYKNEMRNHATLLPAKSQLARQHRYVIKDKMPYYDYFVAQEDDMVFRASHFWQHVRVMDQIRGLRERLRRPRLGQRSPPSSTDPSLSPHQRTLTDSLLARMRPGFIRVEVLQDGHKGTRDDLVKQALMRTNEDVIVGTRNASTAGDSVDASICCDLGNRTIPAIASNRQHPLPDHLIVWETSPVGFAIRPWQWLGPTAQANENSSSNMTSGSASTTTSKPLPFGDNDWFAAPTSGAPRFPATWIGDHRKYFDFGRRGTDKPTVPTKLGNPGSRDAQLFAQSAGWVASQGEILDYEGLCAAKGSFLPPYPHDKHPTYFRDGLIHNVEFFSGQIQLYGPMCQVQRVMSMKDAADFSKHLVYHASNNKQNAISQHRLVPVTTLWEELFTVQKILVGAEHGGG